MPQNGSVTILASASVGDWIVLDQYNAGGLALYLDVINTARGKVHGTYANVGALGTAAASAGAIWEVSGMASANADVAVVIAPPIPTAIRLTCVSADDNGSDGVRLTWALQDN